MQPEPRPADLQAFVRDYYGEQLKSSADLATNACCASGAPPEWVRERLAHVHPEVEARFYGCGFPFPLALEGCDVLDLGCGTGRDVFVLSQLVGAGGIVHGVDMTEAQLALARQHEQWHADRFGYDAPNTRFHRGFIEDLRSLGIEDESLDVIVSNCVVNLSPRKDLVLAEAYRALRPGGELYLSDVLADRRLPPDVSRDPLLHAECLGGAMYENDFADLAKTVGFLDPRVMKRGAIVVQNAEIARKVGAARFSSITYRLLKLPGLDPRCEDFGQVATYRGGIEGTEGTGGLFWLDDHHAFEPGRPERVCRNTARMLSEGRWSAHFDVTEARDTHFGEFPCGPTMAASSYGFRDRNGRRLLLSGARAEGDARREKAPWPRPPRDDAKAPVQSGFAAEIRPGPHCQLSSSISKVSAHASSALISDRSSCTSNSVL